MANSRGRRASGILACVGMLSAMLLASARAQTPEAKRLPVEVTAQDYTFSPETGLAHGEGNVRVRYQDVELEADSVDVNFKTDDVAARGHVVLRRGAFEWRGDTVSGNVRSKAFQFGEFDVKTGVWYGHGMAGKHDADGTAQVDRVQLSTCDLAEPHYSLQAKRVLHYADGRFRAYHSVYRVGPVPVFYWPVVFGDTSPGSGSISVRPGYSSDWGAFLLLARTWQVSKEVDTTVQLDLRSKNGVALGNETTYRGEFSRTDVAVYGLRDLDTPETGDDVNRRFDAQDWRGRARLYHQQELAAGLTLRANADALSDIDMLEDWFKSEYRDRPQPASFADLAYDAQRFSLAVGTRPRLNDFDTVVETAPEVRLDLPRQTLSPRLPLLYQGRTTAGYYQMDWREFEVERPDFLTDPEDYDSLRLDTLHLLYLPLTVADHLRLVPRAGVRLTHYSQSSETEVTPADLEALYDVDNPYTYRRLTEIVADYDDDGGAVTRLAGELGLEVATTFHRLWPKLVNETLNLDGLRHLVRPYINYTYAPDPSEDRDHLYFFDAVDRLTEQNFVRVGAEQRLQTRRPRGVYTFARLHSYADLHFIDDDASGEDYDHLGDFGNQLEFMPTETLKTWLTVVTDLDEMDVRRAEVGTRVGRKDGIRFSLAYLYRDNYTPRSAVSMGSSLTDLTGEHTYLSRELIETQTAVGELLVPINEKTSGRLRLEYDLEETELARQVYEIIRDLHCWVGSLALSEDNGDIRVMVMLYLKAYPSTRVDLGI